MLYATPTPADREAVNRLASLKAIVRLADGNVPLIEPRQDWRSPLWDYAAFDRAVCGCGLTAFVRPASPADALALPAGQSLRCNHVLVAALAAGIRSRREIDVTFPDLN
jgi:hypothetical protein